MTWRTTPEAWKKLKPVAREQRHDATPAESRLWQALRNGSLAGLKFRRQHPIGRFLVDFYCPRLRLVIEVDGTVHDSRGNEDAERQNELEAFGLGALRFRNEEV